MSAQNQTTALNGRAAAAASPKPRQPMSKGFIAVVFGAPSLIMIGAGAITLLSTDARLETQAAQARERVTAIVNQPVPRLPRTTMAHEFQPGWFEPGAVKPDFNAVDVRATQELPYADYRYVTSDVTPTAMFPGAQLEFNPMTKIFYVDRTVPKKRLTGREMLEINRLYRVIGHAEKAKLIRWETAAGLLGSALFMLLAMAFQLGRRRA